MKKDLRIRGEASAVIRTLILGTVALLFAMMAREFWDEGLRFVMPNIIIVLVSLIGIVINWVWALCGGPLRGIRKFCNQTNNPEAMMARIEKVWDEGFVTENCRVDEEYFVWVRGMRGIVIPMREIAGVSYEYGWIWYPGDVFVRLKEGKTKRFAAYEYNGKKIVEHVTAIRMTL